MTTVTHDNSALTLSDYKNVFICVLVGIVTLLACFVFKFLTSVATIADKIDKHCAGDAGNKKAAKTKAKHADTSSSQKKSRKSKENLSEKQVKAKEDTWLLTTLKGHSGEIEDMDYSSNGRHLLTCANDRTILLWSLTDITATNRKSIRINVEYDYARFICWSPDTKAFVIQRSSDDRCQVYKLADKKATPTKTFPLTSDIVAMGISSTGKFMMTCSSDNVLIIWDLKGGEIVRMDTSFKETYYARISPCGGYIAACGDASHVLIWQVDGGSITKKLEIRGHSGPIDHLAFDQNACRAGGHIATVSQDGTLRLNRLADKAFLVSTAEYERTAHISARIALAPQGDTMVVGAGCKLFFYKSTSGELHHVVANSLCGGSIANLLFDQLGRHLFVSGGDKHVKVYHNVTKYVCDLNDAKEKLKEQQTSATRERLQQIVKETEQRLKDFDIDH